MNIERVKYIIWAADMERCINFYQDVMGGSLIKRNEHIAEIEISGATIGIHGGGEGKRTWTGMSFQVPDVVAGAEEIVAGGGNARPSGCPVAALKSSATIAVRSRRATSIRLLFFPGKNYRVWQELPGKFSCFAVAIN